MGRRSLAVQKRPAQPLAQFRVDPDVAAVLDGGKQLVQFRVGEQPLAVSLHEHAERTARRHPHLLGHVPCIHVVDQQHSLCFGNRDRLLLAGAKLRARQRLVDYHERYDRPGMAARTC